MAHSRSHRKSAIEMESAPKTPSPTLPSRQSTPSQLVGICHAKGWGEEKPRANSILQRDYIFHFY